MKASLPIIMLLILGLVHCKNTETTSKLSPVNAATEKKDGGIATVSNDASTHAKVLRTRDLGIKGIIQYTNGTMPKGNAVIAKAGPIEVTLDEFEFAGRFALYRGKNSSTDLPPERMAMPQIQFTMTQSLLARKVIAKNAWDRGLNATKDEKMAWLNAQKETKELVQEGADPNAILKPYHIQFEHVLAFAENEVLADKFIDFELKRVPKEEVWKAYSLEMNKVRALIASSNNVPTGKEIDTFIEKNTDQIDTYFQKNKRKYRIRKKVKLDILRVNEDAKLKNEALENQLEKAANRMHKGDRLEAIAKELRLSIHRSRELIHAENKIAFKSKVGMTGVELKGPRGSYAWIVRGFEAPKEGVLNSPTKREIAALLLRNTRISPALKKRMEEAKSKVLKNVTEKNAKKKAIILGNYGLRWRIVTLKNNGFIPEFGLAEEVVEDAFKHKRGEMGGPIQSREYVYMYKIFGREFAKKSVFDKNYDANRKTYLDAKRNVIIPKFMSKYKDVELHIDTIRIKWGVLKKTK